MRGETFRVNADGVKLTAGRRYDKRVTFMSVAEIIAGLGTCDRKYVGAVIIRDGRCVSWGFNGAPPGLPHCDENAHGYGPVENTNLDASYIESVLVAKGCRNATHAEANALAAAAKQGISTDGGQLFVTLSPCESCSRLIIAAGIREVFYREEYRDRAGTAILKRAGIICQQL